MRNLFLIFTLVFIPFFAIGAERVLFTGNGISDIEASGNYCLYIQNSKLNCIRSDFVKIDTWKNNFNFLLTPERIIDSVELMSGNYFFIRDYDGELYVVYEKKGDFSYKKISAQNSYDCVFFNCDISDVESLNLFYSSNDKVIYLKLSPKDLNIIDEQVLFEINEITYSKTETMNDCRFFYGKYEYRNIEFVYVYNLTKNKLNVFEGNQIILFDDEEYVYCAIGNNGKITVKNIDRMFEDVFKFECSSIKNIKSVTNNLFITETFERKNKRITVWKDHVPVYVNQCSESIVCFSDSEIFIIENNFDSIIDNRKSNWRIVTLDKSGRVKSIKEQNTLSGSKLIFSDRDFFLSFDANKRNLLICTFSDSETLEIKNIYNCDFENIFNSDKEYKCFYKNNSIAIIDVDENRIYHIDLIKLTARSFNCLQTAISDTAIYFYDGKKFCGEWEI